MTLCIECIWKIFKHRLPIEINTGNWFLSPTEFERFVSSDFKFNGSSGSHAQSIDWTMNRTWLSWSIFQYLFRTTMGQCAFRDPDSSKAYHRNKNCEGHMCFAWHTLAAVSPIVGWGWCFHSSIWMGIGGYYLNWYRREWAVCTLRESDHLACYPWASGQHFSLLSLGHAELCFCPSGCCHSMPSCLSCWSHTGNICTLHGFKMGSSHRFVDSPAGNSQSHSHKLEM